MIDPNSAIEYLLANEGALEQNPHDAGSTTNMGISLRYLKALSPEKIRSYGLDPTTLEQDILHLTVDQAKNIYLGEFWKSAPFDKINNQNIVNYMLDSAVNMGLATAVKIAQRAIQAVMHSQDCIIVDGVMGNGTIDLINHCAFYILPVMRAERANVYREIANQRPDSQEFLTGWLHRAYKQ